MEAVLKKKMVSIGDFMWSAADVPQKMIDEVLERWRLDFYRRFARSHTQYLETTAGRDDMEEETQHKGFVLVWEKARTVFSGSDVNKKVYVRRTDRSQFDYVDDLEEATIFRSTRMALSLVQRRTMLESQKEEALGRWNAGLSMERVVERTVRELDTEPL